MRKIYFLFAFVNIISAQKKDTFNDLVQSEMKSASRLMQFTVNPNTLNYDITYHKLEFTVNPTVATISGKVTTTFTALTNMNSVVFDLFDSLIVSSVKRNGASLTFSQPGTNELIINFPSTQTAGTVGTVEITYSGNPTASGFGSFTTTTHAGSPVLYTLSEPFGARDWWPCKQDLNDKVDSIDVYITAPSQYVAVSNGVEPEAPVISGTNKITHFRHTYPIPAYLIAIAVTNYQIYNQQAGLGTAASPYFPIINYMYPESATAQISSLAVTPNILNFFETKFGDYPFRSEKYGHCQFGWGGGMEHTTVSFMTATANGSYGRGLIAHEMAHQWFGDKITCGSWKDIWLNEGFATYLASLVIENIDGATAFISDKTAMINNITAATNGAVYLTDTEALDVNRIFSSRLTYNKGAMVLEMLRFKLGDAAFFQAMKNYITDPLLAYKYALTPQFQAHMEAVYGSSLQEFFNDWVYNHGYPRYSITAFNSGVNEAKITINQTQSDPSVTYFEMPVPVKLTGAGGVSQIFVLNNTTNGQQFTVSVPFTVIGIEFDPEKHLISKSNTVTLAANSFEYENQIQVFPNPANEVLNINLSNNIFLENVTISNILGQIVLESTSNKINIAPLASGVYNVIVKTTAGQFHKKIIKN
jgi:aminopeptidase N